MREGDFQAAVTAKLKELENTDVLAEFSKDKEFGAFCQALKKGGTVKNSNRQLPAVSKSMVSVWIKGMLPLLVL